ncbi:hypothetical protein CfE428DRAFT_5795 [Chthoniobacter flavus Ellin428]|uniref:Uncharacterized protein n=1 Tax=Chthoniobacter flavus Ellin428 TaxID=497964 RepID=B4DA55_9BACT|nr:hypothetical protein [Chthoniobacter flavus]EDY16682.1 hypothetical protein CfE428DRAFT_5795 [Chthoniobacter flavus Ellin428]TCO87255.1 hypothetical protein EV701_12392 [Chthoniobacter flavus]
MSASSDLQKAIIAQLQQPADRIVSITGHHGAGAILAANCTLGVNVTKVLRATDAADFSSQFESQISVQGQIQQTSITDLSTTPLAIFLKRSGLRVNVEILDRITGDQQNDILAGADKQEGLCVFVMPVMEQDASSMQGGDVLFFDAAEVRVRIIEQPRANPIGATAFDLKDDIISALHWSGVPGDGSALAAILAHPLQLAPRPLDFIEGIIEESKQVVRILDVLFTATYGALPS